MKRACSAGLSRNMPVKRLVKVIAPCLPMPRTDMQVCSASIITATPRGFSTSSTAAAICAVRCSWVCSRWREDVDQPRQLRQADDALDRGVGDVGLAVERHHVVLAMRGEAACRASARNRRSPRSRRRCGSAPRPGTGGSPGTARHRPRPPVAGCRAGLRARCSRRYRPTASSPPARPRPRGRARLIRLHRGGQEFGGIEFGGTEFGTAVRLHACAKRLDHCVHLHSVRPALQDRSVTGQTGRLQAAGRLRPSLDCNNSTGTQDRQIPTRRRPVCISPASDLYKTTEPDRQGRSAIAPGASAHAERHLQQAHHRTGRQYSAARPPGRDPDASATAHSKLVRLDREGRPRRWTATVVTDFAP